MSWRPSRKLHTSDRKRWKELASVLRGTGRLQTKLIFSSFLHIGLFRKCSVQRTSYKVDIYVYVHLLQRHVGIHGVKLFEMSKFCLAEFFDGFNI